MYFSVILKRCNFLRIRSSTLRVKNTFVTNSKMLHHNPLNIDKYDCIGFDVDNTLCEYQVDVTVPMEYKVMSEYLIEKGYSKDIVGAPIKSKELDFMQRGLFLDFEKGNILKLNKLGEIAKACHGSRLLNDDEIMGYYGAERKSQVTKDFCNDMTCGWEPSSLAKFRALYDFFDMPASLTFARMVDDMDNRKINSYFECGKDALAAIHHSYSRDHFQNEQSNFFKNLKKQPDLYLKKCSDKLIAWLHELKKTKILFLVSGSNIDFCDFTLSHCIGKNWRDLFDVEICFARKPGFFKDERPFFAYNDFIETDAVDSPVMGKAFSQGNWKQLHQLLAKTIGKPNPSCLYIGDHLVEDVYVPAKWDCCDTVAILEEKYFYSERWGPFVAPDTIWDPILQNFATTVVPSINNLSDI